MDWKSNILAPVIVAVLVSALFYFSNIASKAPELIVPSGAVVPFNLTKCPAGWVEYDRAKGRTIIGSGKGTSLTERGLGEIGGTEKHALTITEMPKHNHLTWYHSEIFQKGGSTGAVTKEEGGKQPRTAIEGGGEPHNNMQPWLALLYCEKQ